ncbi:uncharacterized protein [Penaeus vannamei]|uniref:uncharacterized protein n=1 Tax=Penaeus vannamei TaxID=6689 RepID=UPI00387F5001
MSKPQGSRSPLYQPRTRAVLAWACMWAWVVLEVSAECPKVCECKYRGGKELVVCRNAHFIDIPRGLPPSTQVLDLRHNNLKILPRDAFVYSGLVNLHKVWLNYCKLMWLEDGAFRKVANVLELDLSNNKLRSVPSGALKDLGRLRELRIADNDLSTIADSAFKYSLSLVQLDLSQNRIATIEPGAIMILKNLEVLNIADNKLIALDGNELRPLSLLSVIRLEGNPWHCDCHLRSLRQWFYDRSMAASVPPSCSKPRWLMGRDWQLLENEEFICVPKVTAVAPRVLAAYGENVSLLCNVETEVETTIFWLFGDSPVYNASEVEQYEVSELLAPNNTTYISNFTITDIAPEDQGVYRCVAENRAGRGETNFTVQVSHEVAEVRVANIEETSYMTEGLLGGIATSVSVLLLACSLLYCKFRSARVREPEPKVEESPEPQSSTCDAQHKFAGYHIIPSCDSEEAQAPRDAEVQQAWACREVSSSDSSRPTEVSIEPGLMQDPSPQGPSALAMPPSSVSFVQIPKMEAAYTLNLPEERGRWKNFTCGNRMCGRSVSQASLRDSEQYPDLLDLPHSQLTQLQKQPQQLHAIQTQDGVELQTTNPAFCTRPRTRSDAVCRSASVRQTSSTQASPQNTQQDPSDYRSSSALNLALSEAASNAYAHAHAHLPMSSHQCLPTPPMLESHDQRALRQLVASQRTDCTPAGGACKHADTADPYHFEYHAAQLEKFLQEYRCLQAQLLHMKQSYEAHKRAGSMPRLDCCSQVGEGAQASPVPALPKEVCCACTAHSPFVGHPAEGAEKAPQAASVVPGYPGGQQLSSPCGFAAESDVPQAVPCGYAGPGGMPAVCPAGYADSPTLPVPQACQFSGAGGAKKPEELRRDSGSPAARESPARAPADDLRGADAKFHSPDQAVRKATVAFADPAVSKGQHEGQVGVPQALYGAKDPLYAESSSSDAGGSSASPTQAQAGARPQPDSHKAPQTAAATRKPPPAAVAGEKAPQTPSVAHKEPLKSILKKTHDGSGRRRSGQWASGSSSADSASPHRAAVAASQPQYHHYEPR